MTIVEFILPSISNGLLFWSVNHTTISFYSELKLFKNIWLEGEISIKLPKDLLNLADNHYLPY